METQSRYTVVNEDTILGDNVEHMVIREGLG